MNTKQSFGSNFARLSLFLFKTPPSNVSHLKHSSTETKPELTHPTKTKSLFSSYPTPSFCLCFFPFFFSPHNSKGRENTCGKISPESLVSENLSRLLKLIYNMPIACESILFIFFSYVFIFKFGSFICCELKFGSLLLINQNCGIIYAFALPVFLFWVVCCVVNSTQLWLLDGICHLRRKVKFGVMHVKFSNVILRALQVRNS